MVKRKTCVFISGQGSNLKNLIAHSRDNNFPIKISLVISNNKNANGIKYAKYFKIPYKCINSKSKKTEREILLLLRTYNITFICLAGYMKIISNEIVEKFKKKIINIHPSLLPKFKGLNTFSRIIQNGEKKTGCTVHFVNDKLDGGRIISQKFFYLKATDNIKSLKLKTQKLEYIAFPEAIIKLFR